MLLIQDKLLFLQHNLYLINQTTRHFIYYQVLT